MIQVILAVLLSMPVSQHDRDVPADKAAQLETIAAAVDVASRSVKWPGDRRELAALLLAVGQHESNWELAVGAGKCRPGMCDVDRHGRARAISYWQLHSNPWTLPREEWQALGGLDAEATTRAAIEAAKALRRARGMCGPDPVKVFSAYAGLGCRRALPDAGKRVATFRAVLRRL